MADDANPELCTNGELSLTSANTNTPTEVARDETVICQLHDLPQFIGQLSMAQKSAVITPSEHTNAPSSTSHQPKRMHSIVHDDFLKDRVMIFNIDLEHSGDEAGIVQLSVVAFDASNSAVHSEFNEYVKPPQNARWSKKCMEIHGIRPTQERIKNAGTIEAVWPHFVEFIESRLENGKKNGISAKQLGGVTNWKKTLTSIRIALFPPIPINNIIYAVTTG